MGEGGGKREGKMKEEMRENALERTVSLALE